MKTKLPKCGVEGCRRNAKVLMKCGTDPDFWVYADCDCCLEYLCPVHHDEDKDGRVICEDCYSHQVILRHR